MRLDAVVTALRGTASASLHRRVYGHRWRDVMVLDGLVCPLPRDAIHKLEMALVIREAGGSCVWTRYWVPV